MQYQKTDTSFAKLEYKVFILHLQEKKKQFSKLSLLFSVFTFISYFSSWPADCVHIFIALSQRKQIGVLFPKLSNYSKYR